VRFRLVGTGKSYGKSKKLSAIVEAEVVASTIELSEIECCSLAVIHMARNIRIRVLK